MEIDAVSEENSLDRFKKLEIKVIYVPVVLLLGKHSRKMTSALWEDTWLTFHHGPTTASKVLKHISRHMDNNLGYTYYTSYM